MKKILAVMTVFFSASMLNAQDVITLKNGNAINGKVAEVGVNEIKYYKSDNLTGPLYVAAKADVAQVIYQNGTTDIFTGSMASMQGAASVAPNLIVAAQPSPQVVIVERPVRSTRAYRRYPVIMPRINLGGGHHIVSHRRTSRHH